MTEPTAMESPAPPLTDDVSERVTAGTIVGWVLVAVGGLGIGLCGLLWGLPALQAINTWTIAAASLLPFWWLALPVVILGLLLISHRGARFVALGLAVGMCAGFGIGVVSSRLGSTVPAPTGPSLLVINAEYGSADMADLLDQVERFSAPPDLVVISEHTPKLAETMAALLPEYHYIGEPRTDAGGSAVYSKFPIEQIAHTEDTWFDSFLVRVSADSGEFVLGAVHSAPPQAGGPRWRDDAAEILTMTEPYLDEEVVLAGDFNAIDQHLTMREFYAAGFTNARAEQPWPYWQPTWPVGHRVLPPFATIDHVLCSPSLKCAPPELFEADGTDHMALFTTVSGQPT